MPKIIDHLDVLILEEAKKIVVQEGVDAVSIRKVATSCGLAVGTIYNYYPTKNDLMICLMADYWNEFLKVMDALTQLPMTFQEKIRILYEHFQEFIKTFHEFWLNTGSGKKTTEYTENGKRQKQLFVEALISKMAGIIETAYPVLIDGGLTYEELGMMIMNHFVALSYGGICEYPVFDKTIGLLLQISCKEL